MYVGQDFWDGSQKVAWPMREWHASVFVVSNTLTMAVGCVIVKWLSSLEHS